MYGAQVTVPVKDMTVKAYFKKKQIFYQGKFRRYAKNSTKYVQQNAQIFPYTNLNFKHYACNTLRSVTDHLQGGTKINKIGIML